MDLYRFDTVGRVSPGGYAVDIIALHRLNGHYERTWTDKQT